MQVQKTRQLTISAERWQRIRELFERAVPLEAEERAKLLLEECAGDATLREQVLGLLITSDDDGGELERRVDRAVARAAVSVELAAGQIVGRYRIVQTLGRGGMGTVYLAERADRHYEQRVALKVMARGLFHGEPASRFRAERQILARLSHANIARLLDGGQTEDGTPFLVMEHVEGVRIDDYCAKQKLSIRARLLLIQQVCAAIQYAHQNLIVHRDIKPSNILVAADGSPKLLDFGIAKLLDPATSGIAPPVTRLRDRVLTPESASPEQFRGEPVGTVSDVYSLGALLYELLSGARPFDMAGRSIAEMERLVSQSSPPPPSEKALEGAGPTSAARARSRDLAGDLDNIVLKAMHRDAARRYPSAAALSQDIQNYLDGLPVRARPDTWVYRMRKFLRRNATEVAGAIAAGVLIATVIFFYTTRLAEERDAAERERQTASAIADFMTDVFRRANPNESQGNAVTVREALDSAVRRIDTDLAGQPRLRITLMRNMSLAYNGLGLWQDARTLMEKAVAQERASFGGGGIELARSLQTLGDIYNNMSRMEDAGTAFDEALTIRRALGMENGEEIILLLSARAINLRSRQRFAESIEQHKRAEVLARALTPPDPAVLGRVLQAFASTWSEAGDQKNAEAYAREALPLLRGVTGEGHDLYANAIQVIGLSLRRQYRLAESEQMYRMLIERHISQLGPDHLVVGRAQNNFSSVLRQKGDYAAGERALNDALRIYRLQNEPDALDIAITHHNLGALHHEWGHLEESLKFLDLAVKMKSDATGPRSPQMVSSLLERTAVLRELGRIADARASFEQAKSIAAEKFDKNDRRHAWLLLEQGRLSQVSGALAEAERDLTAAVASLRQQDDPAKLAEALASLGTNFAESAKGSPDRDAAVAKALAAFRECLKIRRRVMPARHKAIAEAERLIAGVMPAG